MPTDDERLMWAALGYPLCFSCDYPQQFCVCKFRHFAMMPQMMMGGGGLPGSGLVCLFCKGSGMMAYNSIPVGTCPVCKGQRYLGV